MFEIVNNYGKNINEIKLLEKYIEFIVEKQNLNNCIFNIIFINNDEIRTINKNYRNVDRVTDVISFALEDGENIDLDEYRLLGDIYISVDKAYEQALEYGHSREREICFLATHGLLHLLGYDHMNEEEEKIMFQKQEELLNEYQIQR